ncbi:probable glycerol-3-phosphate acyltransferase 3 [Asparagus officinalis]|uniref:probable glycerol-3-phosphate acyltransferase 3 n=1 Tax=Asparagus officinalis TaxID=4686 RepID=UPI00098E29B5|nr:probable glycerol-3-phosphate acyltransferase 3 [Asparagus officinalis]
MIYLFTCLLSFFRSKPRVMRSKTLPLNPAELSTKALVFDVEGGLLRSSSSFPYFMLVALEEGGLLRGLILLLSYPLVCCLSQEMGIRVMVMVSFCGLSKKSFAAGRVVLPKFLLEDVGLEGLALMRRGKRRVCVSRMPRVMVEWFLKEYLDVEVVVGRELKVFCGYYTGFLEAGDIEAVKQEVDGYVGVLNLTTKPFHMPLFLYIQYDLPTFSPPFVTSISHCFCQELTNFYYLLVQELYIVSEAEKRRWHPLPREKYPKPLIFHDGRIAFRPNPINTTAMFMWLPLGLTLAISRLIIGLTLPYNISTPLLASTSMKWRLKGTIPHSLLSKAHLLVCNHRTLLDPVYINVALNKPVSTVTYSLSRVSEILSPIKTVRLTRKRDVDRVAMEGMLSYGHNLVVCPEGTTCREPYLLRFSPLFTELADEIVAVAVDVRVSMFYATTAGGFKGFDALFYLLNPSMCYEVEFLETVDTGCVRRGEVSSTDMANVVQGVIGRALGFECTKLTRRDKYMVLAGNDVIVETNEKKTKG